jgi:hypothetical protein
METQILVAVLSGPASDRAVAGVSMGHAPAQDASPARDLRRYGRGIRGTDLDSSALFFPSCLRFVSFAGAVHAPSVAVVPGQPAARQEGGPRNPCAGVRYDSAAPGSGGNSRYAPHHDFDREWVYNEADIDAAKVVWARDMGRSANQELLDYFRDRKVWLVEADSPAPQLRPYTD